LSGLYPNVEVYTAQLRALETYTSDHPDSSDARFVLAYHYLTAGHSEAAAEQYRKVMELNPSDTLSAQLLKSLTGTEPEPKPSEPASPPKPVDASSIVGDWKASRSDGSSFALSLSKDQKYSWKYSQKGKSQEFSGAYTLADNVLILKQNDQPTMVGEVELASANELRFKLAGGSPGDPGLAFKK
jgi:hypothetical protein